jgi:ABC-type branched-subunit amino acid transport system permease subunit
VAFTLSALLGGFGGALFAGGFTYVSPDQFSFAESVVFLTMVLLGGSAAPAGAVLVVGARSHQQIAEDYNSLQAKIPSEFWAELKQQALIESDASLPATPS